jgi:hypothetical protein
MTIGILRLRTSTDTLVIAFRASLGVTHDMCRIESDEEIRRCLLEALRDPAAMEQLRRFWAIWNCEAIRIDTVPDRQLIERVASATRGGAMVAYLAPDSSMKHVFGPPGGKAKGDLGGRSGPAPGAAPGSQQPGAAPSLHGLGGAPVGQGGSNGNGGMGPSSGAGRAVPLNVGGDRLIRVDKFRLEERLEEVLRRVVPKLKIDARSGLTQLLEPAVIHTCAEVMAVWAGSNSHGAGLIVDAMVTASPRIVNSWAIMDAADKIFDAIQRAAHAHTMYDLDGAAERLAWALALVGGEAFFVAIRRGVDRVGSPAAGRPPRARPSRPLPVE